MPEITAEHVSVSLPIFDAKSRSFRGQLSSLGRLSADDQAGRILHVRALQDVSFHLAHGDRLGLIGENGAGKSTLLRVLAGIYKPSSGRLHKRGRSVPLLDITLGLDEYSSGRDNIRLRGLFLGMDTAWLRAHEQSIIEFSELGEYIDMPVRTYSSGMKMRLAFSISMAVDADIILLDEVLGVGDSKFQKKARARLETLTERSGIVVMALHSSQAIMEMCNKALWLHKGCLRMMGGSHEVVRAYDDFMHGRDTHEHPA